MNTVDKINLILKEANISKVNLAKYLGVSRQMVYNYLDSKDLSKISNDKCQMLFSLLDVKNEEELANVELTKEYIQGVGSKIFNAKKEGKKIIFPSFCFWLFAAYNYKSIIAHTCFFTNQAAPWAVRMYCHIRCSP